LSVAGGLLPNADPKSVYVQSIGASDNVIVNITQASASPSSQMVNPPLKDGDRVVVPENQTFFSIIGAVHTPKEYPFRANLTLLDAFTLAGGYEANADLAHVKVTRSDVGGPKTIEINAKDPNNSAAFHLQSGDNVSVGVKSLPYRIDPLALLGIAVGIWGATR
jgi:protein involved in polysaccharide export with SLBB domain